jgi:hypothetical protein
MKLHVYSTAAAVALLLVAGSQGVKADTIQVNIIQDTGNAPVEGTATPSVIVGSFTQGEVGSVPNITLSPYAFNNNGTQNTPYNVISMDATGPGSIAYNVNANFFGLLWGSPDPYNEIEFFSGPNGTGAPISTLYTGNVTGGVFPGPVLTGGNLSCFTTVCQDTGFALTEFTDLTGTIGSVVLADISGNAAFEFGTVQGRLATPLPGAAALFAGGLGLLGLVGRRRRKVAQRLPLLSAV